VWWNREDACLKQILAGVFEQPRVALPPDDLIVDATRFLARTDLANQSAVAVPNRKLRNRRLVWNREKISPFKGRIGIISKDLLDVRGRHLRRNPGVDFDGFDWQTPRQRDGTRRPRAAFTWTRHDDALRSSAGRNQEQ
jgi:hypothetical protein